MNKFQKVKFDSVEAFLDFLPEDQLQMVQHLRQLVEQTFPRFQEKLAYNVPFYSYRKRICFIWPSAIPWGNLSHGVALGFVHGSALDPKKELLEFETRIHTGRLLFANTRAISTQEETIIFLLQEAYLLDHKNA